MERYGTGASGFAECGYVGRGAAESGNESRDPVEGDTLVVEAEVRR